MITKEDIIGAYWDKDGHNSTVAKILEDYEILGGYLDDGGYDAEIYVLMRKDGKLYAFESSHCSCNGFADFEPEETSLEALKMRRKDSTEYKVFEEALSSGKLEEPEAKIVYNPKPEDLFIYSDAPVFLKEVWTVDMKSEDNE